MKKHCLNVWHWWCLINIMDMRFTLEPWRDLTWRYVGPTSTGPSLLELQQRRDSNWRSLRRFILQKDNDDAVRSNCILCLDHRQLVRLHGTCDYATSWRWSNMNKNHASATLLLVLACKQSTGLFKHFINLPDFRPGRRMIKESHPLMCLQWSR